MARPKKEINQTEFEKLCGLQCSKEEICGFLEVSDKTLDRWIRETYFDDEGNPLHFSDVFKLKRSSGKIALRRYQFQQAKHSASMAIWLGKNWLGQSDSAAVDVTVEQKEDAFSKSLREDAERMQAERLSNAEH